MPLKAAVFCVCACCYEILATTTTIIPNHLFNIKQWNKHDNNNVYCIWYKNTWRVINESSRKGEITLYFPWNPKWCATNKKRHIEITPLTIIIACICYLSSHFFWRRSIEWLHHGLMVKMLLKLFSRLFIEIKKTSVDISLCLFHLCMLIPISITCAMLIGIWNSYQTQSHL